MIKSKPSGVLKRHWYQTFYVTIWLLALILILYSQSLLAATPVATLEQQNQMIQNRQLQELRDDQRRALGEPHSVSGANLDDFKPKTSIADTAATCRQIQHITLDGDIQLVPEKVQKQINHNYANRCLSVSDIEVLLAKLTKSFIDRGLITTRAYLPAQDLRTGKLRITIVRGFIERYEIEGGRTGAIRPSLLFPGKPGDLLKLRDLEQGVEQANRLSSNNIKMNLMPGDEPGGSIVVLQNQGAFPLHLYTAYDNQGLGSTGLNILSATLTMDSILGLNEMFAITHRQSVFPFGGGHQSDSNGVILQLPYGYNSFQVNFSQSSYLNALNLPGGNIIDATGRTASWSLGVSRVIYRGQASRISLSTHINTQANSNWFGGEFLSVSSRRLSNFDIGTSAFSELWGGVLNGQITMVQGIDLFGSVRDPSSLSAEQPHAHFRKFIADVGYSRNFTVGRMPLTLSSQFSGQTSAQTLYGSQQILIGGSSSVRGFLNNSLTGNKGFWWRNEVGVPWSMSSAFSGRVYAGFDLGGVFGNRNGAPAGTLSGVAFGLGLFWQGASLDAFLSHALHVPDPQLREGTLVGVRLSYSI